MCLLPKILKGNLMVEGARNSLNGDVHWLGVERVSTSIPTLSTCFQKLG
jgi:hypothetical protein